MEKSEKRKSGWKEYLSLHSLIGSITGAGTAYMAAQGGTLLYIAGRETMNLVYGLPLSPIPELLKEYALYTSLAGAIGEVSGSFLAKKVWKGLIGDD